MCNAHGVRTFHIHNELLEKLCISIFISIFVGCLFNIEFTCGFKYISALCVLLNIDK